MLADACIGISVPIFLLVWVHPFIEKRLNFQFLTKGPFITGPGFIFRSASDSSCQRKELQGTLNSAYCSAKESSHLLPPSLQSFSGVRGVF